MYGCGRCQWWGSKLRITLKGLKCESEVVVAPDEILKGKESVTAKAVAEGMVSIFSRTAIPLQILSDQGTQFLSMLVKELWALNSCGPWLITLKPMVP